MRQVFRASGLAATTSLGDDLLKSVYENLFRALVSNAIAQIESNSRRCELSLGDLQLNGYAASLHV